MFLQQLTARQKSSFLALVTRVMLADGEVAPEEDVVLLRLKKDLGEGVVAPAEEIFGVTNSAIFETRRLRRITYLELMVLAYSDDKIHPDESTVLTEIARAFEFDAPTVEKLSNWAARFVGSMPADQNLLKAEAETLIDE